MILLVILVGNVNAGQLYMDGAIKSIYSSNYLSYDGKDFSDVFGKQKLLTEVSIETFVYDKLSVSYIGLFRSAQDGAAVRYNAIQVGGLFYTPFVRPIARLEEVRIGIGPDRFSALFGGIGMQTMHLYESGTITGQALYLAGGGSTGYDLEAGLKYFFPRLSSYLGGGYKIKSIQIESVRFDLRGPYFEIGILF